jgi:hypothetical protein
MSMRFPIGMGMNFFRGRVRLRGIANGKFLLLQRCRVGCVVAVHGAIFVLVRVRFRLIVTGSKEE